MRAESDAAVDASVEQPMPAVDHRSLDAALERELDVLDRAGLRRTLRAVRRVQGGQASVTVDGRPAVDFSSNDYLGLAGDPRLAAAASAALRDDALGAGAARLISGNHPPHDRLEEELAQFKHAHAVLLYGSGYLANLGTIPALVGRRDAIYADALNHASLIDGCRLSRGEVREYPHGDLGALEEALLADRDRFRRRLIVVDSVFSMDGDLAPLDALVALARRHDAWTYVDDAHGTGVLGAGGRGAAEHWGVEGQIDVVMGTLGKALGVSGAFVAGSRTLIDFLVHRSRTFVFTTGAPPALAAAVSAALRIVEAEPERRDRVRAVARRLRAGLGAQGHEIGGCADGHIIPLRIGDADETVRIGVALRNQAFWWVRSAPRRCPWARRDCASRPAPRTPTPTSTDC